MTFTTRKEPPFEIPRVASSRTGRKIALCGSHSASLVDAPWTDPSWEFWGHASSRGWYRRRPDRYFDLHPPACWDRAGKGDGYTKFLSQNTVPIYMQKKYPEVPASVEYPKRRILMEFGDGRPYFTNQAAWMIALAMTEGVDAIGLFGINYSTQSEYARQRGSLEYWLGRAVGRGVRLVLPEQCSLLQDPLPLYGYESHDEKTGELKPEYRQKEWMPAGVPPGGTAEFPPEIKAQIEAEEREHQRPEWSLKHRFERTDGGAVQEA